ncbi:MAG TPA: hypothetical protein VFK89_00975 [Actinomycetota bacterium]|nr:hypothetical protein [Actinomycetota bacterium]
MTEDHRPRPDPNLPASPLSARGRVVGALLFVVALIVVLGRPIMVAGLREPDGGDQRRVTSPNRTGHEPRRRPHRDRPQPPSVLSVRYPRECFQGSDPELPGRVAAAAGATVSIVDLARPGRAVELDAHGPVGFSPSGRFLVTAGGDLWDSSGRNLGAVFRGAIDRWAWSPVADCLVVVSDNRLVLIPRSSIAPHGKADVTGGLVLSDEHVTNFGFSPDGTRLVLSIDSPASYAGIWMADLASGELKFLQPAKDLGWKVEAWSNANRPILIGEKASLGLLHFDASERVDRCGDEILTISDGRIATFGVTGGSAFLSTPSGLRFGGLSCSPDGGLLAAISSRSSDEGTLVVLDRSGALLQDLGDRGSFDSYPSWGPSGTGVVFLRRNVDGVVARRTVYFVREGGSAASTGVAVVGDPHENLDWSADTPLGHPPT